MREYDPKVSAIHTLRVNMKSLAFEAKAIRYEVKRAGEFYRGRLHEHRVGQLRSEARYTNLALGYVRGRAYADVERNARTLPDAKRLCDKICRHLRRAKFEDVERWLVRELVAA